MSASSTAKRKNDRRTIFGFIERNKSMKGLEFEGIMKYLMTKTGGNIHENGTIEITSNSIGDGYDLKDIINYQNKNIYGSKNEENASICFDFKNRLIQLSSYSIKSQNSGSGNLRNWVIEVSNDKQSWKEVDSHSNDSSLNGSNIVAIFDIKEKRKTN